VAFFLFYTSRNNFKTYKKSVMKKLLPILGILALFTVTIVACNNKPVATAADSKVLSYSDTLGLAQFQSWKMQNERLDPNQYYQQAVQRTPVRTTAPRRSSSSNYGSGSMNSMSQNNARVAQKKGWSKAAKAAVIGGGGGAIAGAVINKKNRVAGGVIGGIVGAGIGYIIGHSQDKKDGR
jgi:hypothetical protein